MSNLTTIKPNDDAIRSLVQILTDTLQSTNLMFGLEQYLGLVATGWAVALGAKVFAFVMFLNLIGLGLRIGSRHTDGENLRKMIHQESEANHLRDLAQAREGFLTNLCFFRDTVRAFNNATADEKDELGDTILASYPPFLMILQAELPQFQTKEFAVVSLIDFAIAADLYIALLASGITQGESWGFTPKYIKKVLRPRFNEVTGSNYTAPADGKSAIPSRRDIQTMDMQLLSDAIEKGEAKGWPEELLETWKNTYAAFSVPHSKLLAAAPGADGTERGEDYPTYARRIYKLGREKVWKYSKDKEPGLEKLPGGDQNGRALTDYDAIMAQHVLGKAEIWPYATGEVKIPPRILGMIDREIYSGPYGKGDDWVPWSRNSAPPVTPRRESVSSALLYTSFGQLDGVQLQHGDSGGIRSGLERGDKFERRRGFDLGPYEYIQSVNMSFFKHNGKPQALSFTVNNYNASNSTIYGPYGNPHAASTGMHFAVNRSGYALSSMYCTKDGGLLNGCEGIFFGWRPRIFVSSSYEPEQPLTEEVFEPLANLNFSSQKDELDE